MPDAPDDLDLFLSLTPDRVLDAVEAAGLATTGLCYPLNSFENRVYEVELDGGERIIAKFYRPGRWSEGQILEEHEFLQDLEEAEIPVCPVRPFPEGGTLRRQDHLWYTLADRRGGRAPAELNHDEMLRMGRLIGRMHNVGASREAPHRLPMTADRFIRDALAWMEEHDTLPEQVRARYTSAASELAEILERRMDGVPLHRVHGDLHLSNVLYRGGVLNLLDFDDMVTGPAVQDLWLVLPGNDDYALQLRESLLEGYAEFRDFDRATLTLVEPLRGLRMIHYACWLARRWHDPIFPITWPHFGTDVYWEEQTRDLHEQLERVRAEDDPPQGGNGGQELTNSDFFWDL